jgi:hypothetical protein
MVYSSVRLIKKAISMEKESFFIILGKSMKDKCRRIWKTEMDLKYILMDLDSKDNFYLVWKREEEFLSGVTEKYTMDNGWVIEKMVVECGKELKDNRILDNGRMEKFKDLVFMLWRMDQDMKGSSKIH